MSGIDRPIASDPRYTAKHLPDTPQVKRLLRKGEAAHVFNDEDTMNRVAQRIIEQGEYTGSIRGYERYGLDFSQPIGYRLDPDGTRTLLYYGEIKINAADQYHVIPRTRAADG